MVSLLRQIIQNNPQITVLKMDQFSYVSHDNENIGELVLEIFLNSSIESVTDLYLNDNKSWFTHPRTKEERSGNVELLLELISKQAGLQKIDLG